MGKSFLFYTPFLFALCSCSQSEQQENGVRKDSIAIVIDTVATDTIMPSPQSQLLSQPLKTVSPPQHKSYNRQERYDDAADAYDDGYAHGWQDGWDDGWHRVRYGVSCLIEPDYAGFKEYYETGYTDGYADGYEKGKDEKE